jgi:hypothetical protein
MGADPKRAIHMARTCIIPLLLAGLTLGGCTEATRTDPPPVADYRSISPMEIRQVQIPEGLMARSQQSGPRYSGNEVYVAQVSANERHASQVASAPRAAQAAAPAADRTSAVLEAAVLPPPVVVGGTVAYTPVIAAIPVGTSLDVQAWASHDLRYVQMNLGLQQAGVPTFRQVLIGF